MQEEPRAIASKNPRKEYVVTGRLVSIEDRPQPPDAQPQRNDATERKFPSPAQILTIEEVARATIEGVDSATILNRMADLGPEARLLLVRSEGKVVRYQVFEDPRICPDLHRGAVIENLKEKPKDVSGWRSHEFFIDTKGCLGDECGRCAIVCPENAIHLMGKGKGSFHEIDPLACKGCFICWVECVRTAADCILVDGQTFDPQMRAKHFGE